MKCHVLWSFTCAKRHLSSKQTDACLIVQPACKIKFLDMKSLCVGNYICLINFSQSCEVLFLKSDSFRLAPAALKIFLLAEWISASQIWHLQRKEILLNRGTLYIKMPKMNTEILVAVKSVVFPPLASILMEYHF